MQTLWQDLRYGARMLLKQPGRPGHGFRSQSQRLARAEHGLQRHRRLSILQLQSARTGKPGTIAGRDRLAELLRRGRRATPTRSRFSDWGRRGRAQPRGAAEPPAVAARLRRGRGSGRQGDSAQWRELHCHRSDAAGVSFSFTPDRDLGPAGDPARSGQRPRQPLDVHAGAVEAGRQLRAGARTDGNHCRTPRAAIPGRPSGAQRLPHSFAGGDGSERTARAASADVRGRLRLADRLRQRSQPATGPRDLAPQRDCSADGARRGQAAPCQTTADRKSAVGRGGRRPWPRRAAPWVWRWRSGAWRRCWF